MPIHGTPTLRGLPLHFQAAVLDPAAPAGFTMSAGLLVTIGA